MEVLKFRIFNYKSIDDSTDCYFSKGVTVLAGKNESGKTSILEALEDFHEDNSIREEAKQIGSDKTPVIHVTFVLSAKEANELLKEAEADANLSSSVEITLIKRYGTDGYTLGQASREDLNLPSLYAKTKLSVTKGLNKLVKDLNEISDAGKVPELEKAQRLSSLKSELQTLITSVQNSTQLDSTKKESAQTSIEDLVSKIEEHYAQEKTNEKFIEAFVKNKLPYFILFSSFDNEFPKSIPIENLKSDEWAQDLQEVSSFSIDNIASTNDQTRKNHQDEVNLEFSDKFKKFWKQDEIKLQFEKEGEKINFWIIENGKNYFPNQRSQGQRWYLSFYVKIVARINDNKPNIILIDEPGLYLHAKAQKDLLLVLREHASSYPVVFSTHSPYLIESDNLEAVRLVERNSKVDGTKILGKVHAHPTANKETLTPVLTAIGLGVNDSIVNLEQKDNVVVEGPADVFYLQAFKILFPDETHTNFINGGGAPNMGIVGAILEGWGARVTYLFDNDSGKKQGVTRLEEWKVVDDVIKEVMDEENKRIEDILSLNDFKKNILEKSDLKYTSSNSDHVTKGKKDKVLLARKFLQKVKSGEEEVSVDSESEKNIKNLLKQFVIEKDEN